MTIGPIIAALTGLRTCDLGISSLSMHSIRETCGVKDVSESYDLFRTFYSHFRELDDKCKFEGATRCLPCKPSAM